MYFMPQILDNGIVYCTCGTCLIPSEQIRKLSRENFDTLSTSNYVIVKGPDHGARCGQSEKEQEYHKAHEALKKARKKDFKTFLQGFQEYDIYRDSHIFHN